MAVTEWPFFKKSFARQVPINPVPPVMKIFTGSYPRGLIDWMLPIESTLALTDFSLALHPSIER